MQNKPSRIILHCSATPDDAEKDFDVKDVRAWHLERGFSDVGYHYVIKRDGEIQAGRPPDLIGAHCKGQNTDTLGVCYIGMKRPSPEQRQALLKLYSLFKLNYGISYGSWFGHNEFNPHKECPGFNMELIRLFLKQSEENLAV